MKNSIGLKIFVGVVVAAVAVVAGIGFYLSGSPSQARAQKLDQQRLNDLMSITNLVDTAYNANSRMPETLQAVKEASNADYISVSDPLTKQPYEYKVTATTTYELCANFQTDLPKDYQDIPRPAYNGFGQSWNHGIGRTCFTRKVNVWQKPAPMY